MFVIAVWVLFLKTQELITWVLIKKGILKERQKELEDILNGKLHGVQRVLALPFHDNPTEE